MSITVTIRLGLSVENEQADAVRDGRTCLARLNSRARTGKCEKSFPSSDDHEQDLQPYIHTYIHTSLSRLIRGFRNKYH